MGLLIPATHTLSFQPTWVHGELSKLPPRPWPSQRMELTIESTGPLLLLSRPAATGPLCTALRGMVTPML